MEACEMKMKRGSGAVIGLSPSITPGIHLFTHVASSRTHRHINHNRPPVTPRCCARGDGGGGRAAAFGLDRVQIEACVFGGKFSGATRPVSTVDLKTTHRCRFVAARSNGDGLEVNALMTVLNRKLTTAPEGQRPPRAVCFSSFVHEQFLSPTFRAVKEKVFSV